MLLSRVHTGTLVTVCIHVYMRTICTQLPGCVVLWVPSEHVEVKRLQITVVPGPLTDDGEVIFTHTLLQPIFVIQLSHKFGQLCHQLQRRDPSCKDNHRLST